MKLVLAEKPSVAQSIAKVLGAAKREDGYLEGNGYVVSWCVGHLVELAQPEVYDAKYSKWAYADLPIFPMDWQYEVSAGTKKQFGILKKLMAREDVASLVCATDAGREGELIFRLVYHKAGCRKPFERLWISSMEDVAIKEGFENLRSGTEYDALYEAALCRERADWIVGINATRLFSTLYGQTLNVGRVMTPTLAMAVMREAAISAFKPELFYTVQIGLDGFTAASERFKTKAAAEAVKQSCSVAIVQKAECKEKTEKPPALYDLTSLQREANRVLGYTAQQTLDYTQNLYEKKLVTYPRTDSRFLTEDMAHSLTDLVKLAFHTFPVEDVDNIPVHAEQVVNNKKVTDHHAIIPTRELQKCNLSELPKGELAILQLISNRLCVAVGDPHRYAETVIELDCGGTVFSTKGKTVVQDGWKALVQKNDSTKSDENVQTLPSVSVGDEMTVSGTEIKEGKTSPPKHFTEDTLLSAMETAGADEMPDEVERKGLGTPATRAGIIEKLVRIGFLERKGDKKTKHLIPTHKGTALVTVMPEQIQSPSMTADWEEKLLLMDFLKHEYGTGGHSHACSGATHSGQDHDAKGVAYTKSGCDKLQMSWAQVVQRIDGLIRKGRYLSPEEEAERQAIEEAKTDPLEDVYDRFAVIDTEDGEYAIWDNQTDDYYVDPEGVTEYFTDEWLANDYLEEVRQSVAAMESVQPEAPVAEPAEVVEASASEEPKWNYQVGDTVYLDDTAFRVEQITDREVQLRDPTLAYPIFRAENRENFERMLSQDERNHAVRVDAQTEEKPVTEDFLGKTEPRDYTPEYQLLDRLRMDCEYFLGAGQHSEKHLWAGNRHAQIAKMRELYEMIPDKPEWLTPEMINSYEERMAPR